MIKSFVPKDFNRIDVTYMFKITLSWVILQDLAFYFALCFAQCHKFF